jgi:peptidoglycan/LPS O-acetylase OafA/YrhL
LRGIAAIWVICFHYGVVYFAFHPEQISCIFNKGYLAVDMFFMLSGFVLSHVYWKTFAAAPFASDQALQGRDYWRFIGARIARLYPLHLFNLSLFLIATLGFCIYGYIAAGKFAAIPLHGARSLTALVANLLMLQGLNAKELAWNYPAWSISIEFLAYFLFPLALPLIALADRRKRLIFAGVAFASLCLFAYLANGDFNQWNGPITLLRCLPEFIVGLRRDTAIAAVLCGMLVLLHFGVADLIIVAAFPVVILAAVMNGGRVAPIVNSAPLVWLGDISYSLYLAHGFVQFVATRLLASAGLPNPADLSSTSAAGLFVAMVGATLLMAMFTYREVEIVGRSRLRRLLQPQGEPSPAKSPRKNRSPSAAAAGL